jgi:hypothetical protein
MKINVNREIDNPKAWANRLLWRQLHDSAKPHPTALMAAIEVMGADYVPHKPASNNDGLVNF